MKTTISLSDLSKDYGSDKHVHGFTDFYENYAKTIDAKIVCEIGLGGIFHGIKANSKNTLPGASSRMWLDYFPDSKVFVMDNFSQVTNNELEVVFKDLQSLPRFSLIKGDQSKKEDLVNFLNIVNEEIDFFIDDGGHTMQQQQLTLATVFPRIKSGRFYALEDLHTSVYPGSKYGVTTGVNTTLRLLENFKLSGKIESSYISESEKKYLEDNIEFCEIWKNKNKPNESITSIIKKK